MRFSIFSLARENIYDLIINKLAKCRAIPIDFLVSWGYHFIKFIPIMRSSQFFAACVGIGFVLFAASALVLSINHVNAKPEFPANVPFQTLPGNGDLVMAPFNRTVYSGDGSNSYQEHDILVYNARTGKSTIYYFGSNNGQYGYYPSKYNLPINPLR